MDGIFDSVTKEVEGGVRDGGVTEEGFLHLTKTFVWKGKSETIWKMLIKHGYGNDLKLTEEFLYPKFDVPSDCSVELSQRGYQFFTDIFEAFDKVRSNFELDTLLSI